MYLETDSGGAPTGEIDFGGFCEWGFLYRLKLAGPNGDLIGEEHVRALTDQEAIDLAMPFLASAAMVQVWSEKDLVCQLRRKAGLH